MGFNMNLIETIKLACEQLKQYQQVKENLLRRLFFNSEKYNELKMNLIVLKKLDRSFNTKNNLETTFTLKKSLRAKAKIKITNYVFLRSSSNCILYKIREVL